MWPLHFSIFFLEGLDGGNGVHCQNMDEVLSGIVNLTAKGATEYFRLYAHQHTFFYGALKVIYEQGEGKGMG